MTNDGTNTYTWDRADRLLSMGVVQHNAYNGLGQRVSQTVGGIVTEYLLDVQPGLTKVIAQTVDTDTTRFIHGPMGIQAQQDNLGSWTTPVLDGLGSVRDNALDYDPFGVPDSAITGFAFTGEMRDANGLQYHRARYYVPGLGVWPSLDPVEGVIQRAMSLNGYSWVEGNVVNRVDPSGRCIGQTESDCEACCWEQWRGEFSDYAQQGMQECYQSCVNNLMNSYEIWAERNGVTCSSQSGLGQWECSSAQQAHGLKDAFLRSAARHNRIPNMDDAGFAALVASLIEAEGRWRTAGISAEQLRNRNLEDLVASFGCVVSGTYVQDAYDSRDFGLLIQYLMNMTIPDVDPIHAYASVGIGNVKLPTAASLWTDQACNAFGECTGVDVNPLVTRNALGFEVNLLDPFTEVVCSSLGACTTVQTSEVGAYSNIRGHLLQDDIAIEYVAALLEQGALRASQLGMTPTAFNSVTWYIRSVQTENEINRLLDAGLPDPRGHAVFVLRNIPTALQVLGQTSSWQLDGTHEPGYAAFCSSTGYPFCG